MKLIKQQQELKKYGDDCYVVTQNIDNLFERAGCKDVIHVHGELTKMECITCGNIWDTGYKKFDTDKDKCPKCYSFNSVKPYIVFFGASAPRYKDMLKAFYSSENKDSVIVIVGTMGNVVAVEDMIRDTPCKKILNNLEQSVYLDSKIFDKTYFENATTALSKIEKDIDEYWKT